ncbi:MAG: hypothetical protein A4E34_00593 [Methanoregula sp. PtaU1.Bin006]|nr:MAG: hypothetical protein A4E33_02464 [Methanoregula sp. PtaB.Bin085]OPY35593.1 MAG: hypothetical protein A4E34_00593 [Methanoregula sp. PtaU1.Bin006]
MIPESAPGKPCVGSPCVLQVIGPPFPQPQSCHILSLFSVVKTPVLARYPAVFPYNTVRRGGKVVSPGSIRARMGSAPIGEGGFTPCRRGMGVLSLLTLLPGLPQPGDPAVQQQERMRPGFPEYSRQQQVPALPVFFLPVLPDFFLRPLPEFFPPVLPVRP